MAFARALGYDEVKKLRAESQESRAGGMNSPSGSGLSAIGTRLSCYNRPMAYAVAILLISALTTVGLLALWAATSTAHWFWRTMGFLAAISPVLLIPAY